MDDAIAADPNAAAIVVMPDGSDAQWYDNIDGSLQNQRYVLDYLVPYVDRHFRTIAGARRPRHRRAVERRLRRPALRRQGAGSLRCSRIDVVQSRRAELRSVSPTAPRRRSRTAACRSIWRAISTASI